MVNLVLSAAQVIALAEQQADLLTSVATGGRRIQDVESEYTERARTLRANFSRLGIEDPFPWVSLWDWRGRWSRDFPGWAERRRFIANQLAPAVDALTALEVEADLHDAGSSGAASWEAVDERVAGLIEEMSKARSNDDWQDVGRRSREIMIDVAKLIADPALLDPGEASPKAADAKAWLGKFLDHHASGTTRAELRAWVRSTWDLAQKVTHAGIAEADAFAAAQAVVSLVRIFQKLRAEVDAVPPAAASSYGAMPTVNDPWANMQDPWSPPSTQPDPWAAPVTPGS